MKKLIFTICSLIITVPFIFGGGIVTNTNQSASWVRSMVRDASVDVDAVFFNPAGLTHLEDGFYIQVNTQTVWQGRNINSTFPTLNDGQYKGSTFVPVLPTGFAVYKKGKLAVSAGFTVIGGGGSAEFERGLPEFEELISTLVPSMNDLANLLNPDIAVTGYSADIRFSGSSAYYGIQAGLSYKINDVLSVGIGGRYIMANNSYTGHIKDISLLMANGPVLASDYINNMALPTVNGAQGQIESGLGQLNGALTQFAPLVEGIDALIAFGFGGLTIEQLLLTGLVPEDQIDLINGTMAALGLDPSLITLSAVDMIVDEQLDGINTQIEELSAQQTLLNNAETDLNKALGSVGDKEVDVTQSGKGFTPIVSVDLSFMEGDLGLAMKYEHKTTMKVTTVVTQDDTGIYIDGEEVTADMPSMISVGLRYKATDALRLQTGLHYYLDNGSSYGKKDDDGKFVNNGEEAVILGETQTYLTGNSYEAAFGLEYDLIDMLTLSGGILYTASNPNDVYQSGLSYTLNTTTFGVGAKINVLENFAIELGYSNTSYTAYTKSLTDPNLGAYEETYDKTASVFAAGLTYRF